MLKLNSITNNILTDTKKILMNFLILQLTSYFSLYKINNKMFLHILSWVAGV